MGKEIKEEAVVDLDRVPKHMAFIMDGNGRWANRRGLPRTAGHRAGADALQRVLMACKEYGVKIITLYAFSTENYNRSDTECKFIFDTARKFARHYTKQAIENNIRINICGDLDYSPKLDEKTKRVLRDCEEQTKHCDGHILNLCLSYGGRHEIVEAVNKLIEQGATKITEQDISNNIYTQGQPDPDLIVRASGEFRLSNFLVWQMAYSEFYFTPVHWPDFDKEVVKDCILEYQKRDRRFGNVK